MVGTGNTAYEETDRAADLEVIMSQYEAPLLRYAARILNDPDAAQDVVQNTFIKLCKRWKDDAPPAKQLKGWLYRVTHNHAVDHIRRESRMRILHQAHAEEVATSYAPKQSRQLQKEDAMNLALQHLRKLKPEEQQVVLLRLQEGLSYKEISEVTKRSEGNVGCILHHAVKKLARSLKQAAVV